MSLPLESTPNTTMVIPATKVASVPLLSPTTTATSSSTMVLGASTTVAAATTSSSSASGTLLPPRRVSFRDSEIGDVVRKVTFDAEPAIQEYVCEHDHQDEEEQPQDDEVNDSVALLTHHTNGPLHHLSSSQSSESNSTRGFELKHSPSRQTRKFTILKSLIRNQSKCSAEQLGKLARRCNAWAREAARVQGLMDYQDAYRLLHDDTTTTIDDDASKQQLQLQWPAMEQFPLPLKQKSATGSSSSAKKRPSTASSSSSSSSEEEQRRVRARVL